MDQLVDIYCYYVGMKDSHHIGIAKYIDDLGNPHVLYTSYSTHPKWVQQDLGHRLIVNTTQYMKSFLNSRDLYIKKFGRKRFRTIWLEGKHEFDELLKPKYIQLKMFN